MTQAPSREDADQQQHRERDHQQYTEAAAAPVRLSDSICLKMKTEDASVLNGITP